MHHLFSSLRGRFTREHHRLDNSGLGRYTGATAFTVCCAPVAIFEIDTRYGNMLFSSRKDKWIRGASHLPTAVQTSLTIAALFIILPGKRNINYSPVLPVRLM